ncbi:MAG: ABC transporter permease subunit [Bdellovibrionales bacterium]|nr:ABC transporter permease subunit [Bdellovibrionales bacterium]
MVSRPLIGFILTAALRDKLVMTLMLMILLGAGMSVFLGSSGVTEQESFAVVFGAGGLRFLGVLGIVLFVCFYMRRAFDTKEVEFLLSRPISRMTFLFSHALAFSLIALAVTAAVAAAVFFLGNPDKGGWVVWSMSIGAESVIMAVTALFFSMVLSSAAGAALATLGFYVLCRLIGMLIGIAAQPPENVAFAVMNNLMDLISVVIPRLDIMGQTSWLVYGVEGAGGIALGDKPSPYAVSMLETLGTSGFILAQGGIFVALVLAAAAFDFARREF